MRLQSLDQLPTRHREQAAAQMGTEMRADRKRSKYGNTPVVVDGERYDSQLEYRMCQWLRARVSQGEVLWFTRQVPFLLEGGVIYKADALAARAIGGVEVFDAKGHLNQVSANKIKQVKARYGVDVILWPKEWKR